MAVKASATVTIIKITDISSVTRYYKLQSSTASVPVSPTTDTPSGWTDTEPTYTQGSTNTLYTVEKTTFTDGTFSYSKVSKSTSYEAAKAAYNKANTAQEAATSAKAYTDAVQNQFGYKYKRDIFVYGDDTNKYYPVYFGNGDQRVSRELMITRSFIEQGPDDWNTATHKGSLTLKIKAVYGGWGGANYYAEILDFAEKYCTMVADVKVNKFYGKSCCVWLRGGGTTGALYHVFSDQPIVSNDSDWHCVFPLVATQEGVQIGWNGGTEETPTYKVIADAPLNEPDTDRLTQLQTSKALELRATKEELTNYSTNDNVTTQINESLSNTLEDYVQVDTFDDVIEQKNTEIAILTENTQSLTQQAAQLTIDKEHLQEQINTITKYFTFDINGLTIGESDSPYKVVIDNDEYKMMYNDSKIMWIANGEIHTPEITVKRKFTLFGYRIELDSDGNVNWDYVGDEGE